MTPTPEEYSALAAVREIAALIGAIARPLPPLEAEQRIAELIELFVEPWADTRFGLETARYMADEARRVMRH